MKLLNRKIVIRFLPLMDKQNVSLVSRGIQKSTVTKKGFTEIFLSGKSLSGLAKKNETWLQRRNLFLNRQTKNINNKNLFNIDGSPTRYHLSLIAWAYSPDVTRLKKYIRFEKLKNNQIKKYLG